MNNPLEMGLKGLMAGQPDSAIATAFAQGGPPSPQTLGSLMQPQIGFGGNLNAPTPKPAPETTTGGLSFSPQVTGGASKANAAASQGQQVAQAVKAASGGAPTAEAAAGAKSPQEQFIESLAGIEAPEQAPPPSPIAPRGGGSIAPSGLMQMLQGLGAGGGGGVAPGGIPTLAALMRGRG